MSLRDGNLFLKFRNVAFVLALVASVFIAVGTNWKIGVGCFFAVWSVHLAIYGAD